MAAMGDPAKIILAAQVLKGDSPVIGAKVMATVTLESTNNGTVVTLPPIRLHDNGYGGKNYTHTQLNSLKHNGVKDFFKSNFYLINTGIEI